MFLKRKKSFLIGFHQTRDDIVRQIGADTSISQSDWRLHQELLISLLIETQNCADLSRIFQLNSTKFKTKVAHPVDGAPEIANGWFERKTEILKNQYLIKKNVHAYDNCKRQMAHFAGYLIPSFAFRGVRIRIETDDKHEHTRQCLLNVAWWMSTLAFDSAFEFHRDDVKRHISTIRRDLNKEKRIYLWATQLIIKK